MHFPWTEGGLALLDTICNIVEDNGGLITYHEKIFNEVYEENTYLKHKHLDKNKLRLIVKYKINRVDALALLDLSVHDYNRYRVENKDKLEEMYGNTTGN